MLRCSFCGQYPTIKSNKAIHEELNRFWKPFDTIPISTCPNQYCPNHHIDKEKGKSHYHSFGRTKAGSKRYRCKACGRTFVASSSPVIRQRKPHKNASTFRLLVNKVPFRRICEVEGITMSTLYRKIDFVHRQCIAFAAERERNLPTTPIARLYIGVDRQDYMINWSDAKDRRNIIFRAVGSADNRTGYVFGMYLNFDPLMDADLIERDDVKVFEDPNEDLALPKDGMQVQGEYTMYRHFFFLRRLLGSTEKIRFFLDQDSAFRAACLSAFSERIKKGRVAMLFTCGLTPRQPLTKNARYWQTIDATWRQ